MDLSKIASFKLSSRFWIHHLPSEERITLDHVQGLLELITFEDWELARKNGTQIWLDIDEELISIDLQLNDFDLKRFPFLKAPSGTHPDEHAQKRREHTIKGLIKRGAIDPKDIKEIWRIPFWRLYNLKKRDKIRLFIPNPLLL